MRVETFLLAPGVPPVHHIVAALLVALLAHAGEKGMFLETAHPVKFYDVVEPVINEAVPVPEAIQAQLKLAKKSQVIEAEYGLLSDFLLNSYSL